MPAPCSVCEGIYFEKVRDGELEEKATCREFRQVRTEDKLMSMLTPLGMEEVDDDQT